MTAATRRFESAAASVAKSGFSEAGGGDPVADTVRISEAARAFSANLAVLRVADETAETVTNLIR